MPAPELLLVVPQVWRTTTELFEQYAGLHVEAGCFWYGIRTADFAVALLVGIPRQTNRRQNFEVAADDLAQLVRQLPDGLVVLAQVHSHPGSQTDHSSWDDGLIVSQKVFSLVLPDYGADAKLGNAKVHEFADGNWKPLTVTEAASRIRILPPLLEGRRG